MTDVALGADRDPAPPMKGRARAFAVTWIAYGGSYLGRKGLSVAKRSMEEAFGERALYGVETVYLAMYCVGQWLSGGLVDRVGARRLLACGLALSGVACIAYGSSSAWLFFVAAMAVNGLAQATGWPGANKAMVEWTPPRARGVTMGLWSTCYQVGGIVATWAAASFLAAYGFRWAFIGPGLALLAIGALVLGALERGPLGARRAADSRREADDAERAAAERAVLRSVVIWSYGASYLCIKLIRYSLLLWLPYYLETVLRYTKKDAGQFSTSFEVGGVVGTIALGLLSDRLRKVPRAALAAASLVLLAGAFGLYLRVGASSVAANFLAMALVGALLFGPDALISGAAAQDASGPLAAGMAAGLVNGVGSIGGVLQEVVTRTVTKLYGWDALFYTFVALSLAGAAALVPALLAPRRAPL